MAMETNLNVRIEQWEKMTREAPDDMAWFSLGNAYKDAQRHRDAESAFAEAIKLNPGMSRAYQLRGQMLMDSGRNEEAAEVLAAGYKVAAERGDVMPQRAIASFLQKLGKPLPEVKQAAPPPVVAPGQSGMVDRKTGLPGTKMPDPPMRGPLGKFIFDHYTQETFREWVRQGTKVINELRLDFSNENHQRIYEENMLEWLGFTRDEATEYAKEKN